MVSLTKAEVPTGHDAAPNILTSKDFNIIERESNSNNYPAIKSKNRKENVSDDQAQHQLRGLRRFLLLLPLFVSCVICGLDTTISADVQGSIVETFGHAE